MDRRLLVWSAAVAAWLLCGHSVLPAHALGLQAGASSDTTLVPAAADTTRPGAAVPRLHETMVVTGSRTEQQVKDAPAALTVITAQEIETAPIDDYGDLLRTVPGLNVAQISARDIQIVGRASSGSLATSELVLVDGRSLYLDFFGFVMWDFLPINPREIKQIEVLRGPGSAVWGANALTGVINLVTKSPREMLGTTLVSGYGEFETGYGSLLHAGVRGKLGYKVSGGYFTQDAYPRPSGLIPGLAENQPTSYPPFANRGTQQPKFDAALYYQQDESTEWRLSGGVAATDGILHSGIGPFDVDTGTLLAYGQTQYARQALRASFATNVVAGDATNLLTVGPGGQPISFAFDTQTYMVDASNSTPAGSRNVVTYGTNARHSVFDLSIAPQASDRSEVGVFVQDEFLILPQLRWVAGVRWDNLEPIESVFSPRTSLIFSPTRDHTFRVSFNRAFRAPSVVENHLDVTIVNRVQTPGGPFTFSSRAHGNVDLEEEKMTAVEFGYVTTLAERISANLSVYRNDLDDDTDFYADSYYSTADPPPGWPFPAVPPNTFPKSFTYRNVGEIVNLGLEAGVHIAFTPEWKTFLNYSFQDDSDVKGIDASTINRAPKHRFNVGASWDSRRYFASANVNFQDEAFWTDVLDSRFWGTTDDFTQVNGGAGVRLWQERVTLAVIGSNIFDADVQQHIFGDLIRRKITGEVRFHY